MAKGWLYLQASRLIMCDIHLGHSGIEGCLKRARESVYWPGMTADIREHIQGCEICNEYAQAQQTEHLMSHEVPTRPWQRVGTDLFTFDGNEYLITVCYYSNFWEIDRLYDTASQTVIHKLKSHFARYGKPDELISDNGPQFSSAKFQKFMRDWDITHNTSSPHYPQSNGKAESAVKTAKRMMRKTTNEDQYLVLLSIRNTPQQGIDLSPAQRLMGRRTKTLVPATHTLLKMQTSRRDTVDKLRANQRRQQLYYNQAANVLPDLENDRVRVKPHVMGQKSWEKATVCERVGPRSYMVKTSSGRKIRRNRVHLRKTTEQDGSGVRCNDLEDTAPSPINNNGAVPPTDGDGPDTRKQGPRSDTRDSPHCESNTTQPTECEAPDANNDKRVSRSGRPIKRPTRLLDFVTQ